MFDLNELKVLSRLTVNAAVLSAFMVAATGVYANEVVFGPPEGHEMSAEKAASKAKQAREDREKRFFSDPKMLPNGVRAVLNIQLSGEKGLEAFGGGNHPYTTEGANSLSSLVPEVSSIDPVDKFPWRATGKLFMKFGNDTFVCTASVIEKGLLVTAAHCVHNFGEKNDGFADAVTFEPGRHESSKPFGTWTAKQWWVPKVYWDGSDKCLAEAPGVVCQNDVAVIVIDKLEGKFIGDVTGKYDFITKDNFGYAPFLGKMGAEITQLGYPAKDFPGDKMIRTDSLGYQEEPNNVIIGSNQTGGSSGGPWLQNFGAPSIFSGPPATDAESNQVSATTSWGYTSGTVKVQGASRFATNDKFTIKSNIQTLVEAACGANPGFC
ncbi:MAG: trypsin-like serine protease [Nitrospirota bacterium]